MVALASDRKIGSSARGTDSIEGNRDAVRRQSVEYALRPAALFRNRREHAEAVLRAAADPGTERRADCAGRAGRSLLELNPRARKPARHVVFYWRDRTCAARCPARVARLCVAKWCDWFSMCLDGRNTEKFCATASWDRRRDPSCVDSRRRGCRRADSAHQSVPRASLCLLEILPQRRRPRCRGRCLSSHRR